MNKIPDMVTEKLKQEILSLIDDIKYQSDSLTELDNLHDIQVKVMISKINKLSEKAAVLLYFLENEKIAEPVFDAKPTTGEAAKLNDDGKKNEEKIKADQVDNTLNRRTVDDLMEAIGINEKYLYSSELFSGKIDEFTAAIRKINQYTDFSEASIFIGELSQLYDWDEESEVVSDFRIMVERRFDQP